MKKMILTTALLAMGLTFQAHAEERCVNTFHAVESAATGADNYEAGGGTTGSLTTLNGQVVNDSNIAIGPGSEANGSGAIAQGDFAKANGIDAMAEGRSSEASGDLSVASGSNAKATKCFTTATGAEAIASGKSSTATGFGSEASGQQSTANGEHAKASGAGSTANGSYANASGYLATASGANANATSTNATATGANSSATAVNATANGANAKATAINASAYGTNSRAQHENSVALGAGTSTTRKNEVNVGHRVIGDVADAQRMTDAVNLRQMVEADDWTLKQANEYTDWRLSQLKFDLNRLEDRMNTIGAQSAALTMMSGATNSLPVGKVSFGGGVGFYGNKAAFAVGAKIRSSERTGWSMGLSYADGKAMGGIGFAWSMP